MPIPVQLRTRLAAMLEVAYDAFLADESINLVEHFVIAGRRVKVHISGHDLDHPKDVTVRIVWKPADGA